MVDVSVSVTSNTLFNENDPTQILTITFTNATAFTPKTTTNYFYVATLTEGANTQDYVFKKAGAGTEVTANTPVPFTVENSKAFTTAAVVSEQAIYYTANA